MRYVTAGALLLFAGSIVMAGATNASSPRMRVAQAAGGAASCLSYAGRVSLAGRLTKRTFPGPPNYESVARGDRPERVLVLVLNGPVCMAEDKADRDGMSPAIARITEVQLAAAARDLGGVVRGQALRLSGKVYAAHTGYHHTSIVMESVTVEASP